ncbi:uncharacterized protein in proB 3'region-like [Clavelina lepadiformis]|uniref:uncharacterized protein in proB 3'region-like n=1 Tax=Clavelina lepadiformis TaxID=159417 RepID=UPI0040426F09
MAKNKVTLGVLLQTPDFFQFVRNAVSEGALGRHVSFKYIDNTLLGSKLTDELEGVEVLLTDPKLCASVLTKLPKSVKWVQTTWAGLDYMFSKLNQHDLANFEPHFVLTRLGGVFGPVIADYVLGAVISLERDWKKQFMAQSEKKWLTINEARNVFRFRSLEQLTVGIIGIGDIGITVAEKLKAAGMRVHGLKRSELKKKEERYKAVDELFISNQLEEFLSRCDYICNTLPHTRDTVNLLSNDVLHVCKAKKPGLINVGRGTIIDEQCLVKALNNGWISSAFLDVFTNEPLSPDSPLWEMVNVTITPHSSGPTQPNFVKEGFLKNLQLYIENQPLQYVFDWEKGY